MSNSDSPEVDAARVIAELKDLREHTSVNGGAQRVAFTPSWVQAREWLHAKLRELPVTLSRDEAGNDWATLPGGSPRALLIGGHMDSVPNGGWLDGCLNVLAGLAILRRLHQQYPEGPPVTVRLVDWADEEGARFGKSLFGSSACSGNLILEEVARLRDAQGLALPEVLAQHGLSLDRVKESGAQLKTAAAYMELHIEQGPVLLDLGLPLGAVQGTYGVERYTVTFHGQAAHSGSTPMGRRRDAFLAAAEFSLAVEAAAKRAGGVGTVGSCVTAPGIPTSVVAECRLTLDLRHLSASVLADMLQEARAAAEQAAQSRGVTVVWSTLQRIEPVLFHPELQTLCQTAIKETVGSRGLAQLPSGPLHDAAEVARAGVPSVMMFVQSLHGISHNPLEDTLEEDLLLAVQAFDRLADRLIGWILAQPV